MKTDLLLIAKRLIVTVLIVFVLGNLIKLNAQYLSLDSTADYSFDQLKLSELIRLKRSFAFSDTSSLSEFLQRKKFIKRDTALLFFSNDSLNQSLEFCDKIPEQITFRKANIFADVPVLILKSTNTAWKNVLLDFIRQQKWNEDIVITENNTNEFEVEFHSLSHEILFFIILYNGDYSLVLL